MEKKYEGLFQPLTLPNKVTLKNRFVLAPMTHVSSHDDGTISDVELEYIEKRSKDVGLSISAASHVTPIGQAFTGQPSVAFDSDIDGLKKLAQAMKKNGAQALVQIHHGGAKSLPSLTPNGDVVAPSEIQMHAQPPHNPSKVDEDYHVREITVDEINETIKAFGDTTRRVIEAGFDGIEIHGANHYLIHQFVSPYYNRRTDEWKYDDFKFPLAVIDEVVSVAKEYANEDFIIGYRFSPEEAESPGISMELTKELLEILVQKPLDYLHVSLGDIHSKTREGKYSGESRLHLVHEWIDGKLPLIGIGSIYTAEDALSGFETGDTELIALGRGILLDHDFVGKIKDGRADEITSEFDPDRTDLHELPEKLWHQLNDGHYGVPRTK